jgi:hypothetical protein
MKMRTAKVQIGKQLDTRERCKVDEEDLALAKHYEDCYNQLGIICLGDIIRNGDRLERISVMFGNGTFQTCNADEGAFFISPGWASHSGGHRHGIHQIMDLKVTQERMPAEYWFFHRNEVQGGGRVDMTMDVRVWELKE